ncbi:MAG: 4-alpha-glucanotransferase [Deltaproteobacteria bacterium]|nr:4-alpha-glucanotransferase [Deltaproteobacteria bacterium]MBW2070640.1 4-alpha-glucanotransferase [Deltaproteobacteria bacterium]
MLRRASGILLHITSLPSRYGVGDFGPAAYEFVDFLDRTGQSYWQILPLNPTDSIYLNSPYQSVSAFAGNPLLISPELLWRHGLLSDAEAAPPKDFSLKRVDYQRLYAYKTGLLRSSFQRFRSMGHCAPYEHFRQRHSYWLEDFTLFVCLKTHFQGKIWTEWPQEIRHREPQALQAFRDMLQEEIEFQTYCQYLFYSQWHELKRYCNEHGIHLIGDIPIYVHHDSADVWTHRHLFKLDDSSRPYVVAGVPPDYFSSTGQLWGNPVYDWEALQKSGFAWWIRRMELNLSLFDLVRLDHFRGLVAYWEVPATEATAINGCWVKVPTKKFFDTLLRRFPLLPIIAEDLGYITPDVREVLRHYDLPGMKVLLFAFGGDVANNPYIPHNHVANSVVYTGTHDNNTVRGWFEHEATQEEKRNLYRYLGRQESLESIHLAFIRLAMMSTANLVVLPLQDVLGLGVEARMNKPATLEGNWEWRLTAELLSEEVNDQLAEMTHIYGRA